VATVVTKLLINIQPDYALFGEKDYQQLLVIKRMVADLCFPVEVIGMPILRDADGLAMSSRNSYLNTEERARAPLIYQSLQDAAAALQHRPVNFRAVEDHSMQKLAAAGFRPEYFAIRRASDLGEPAAGEQQLSILVAAWLGAARLIDNIRVNLV
jgi:pantoate--beta-alanine ligase